MVKEFLLREGVRVEEGKLESLLLLLFDLRRGWRS